MAGKSFDKMAYQYYVPRDKLYNKPVGHFGEGGSEWRSGSMNLFMWGRSLGHTSKGKTLVACEGVDVCFGDGSIDHGVSSVEEAEKCVKGGFVDTDTWAFWHAPTQRLIQKPKNRGGKWSHGDGRLFIWADEPLMLKEDGSSDGFELVSKEE